MRRDLRSLAAARRASPLLALALLAATAACNVLSIQEPPRAPDVFDKVRSIDLLPRVNEPRGGDADTRGSRGQQAATYYGSSGGPETPAVQRAGGSEGYELNFENT